MAIRQSTTQWALDTNFLLHLVDGKENVCSAWEIAKERGIRLFATGVVFDELLDLVEHGETESLRTLSFRALKEFRQRWGVEPASLSEVEQSIAALFAANCLERGIVPQSERNDALLLGETAVKGIPFLISSDSHLVNADHDELVLLFHAKDLPVVSVLHPRAALRSLGG